MVPPCHRPLWPSKHRLKIPVEDAMAENKSRVIRVAAVLMVAAGAGFVMQNMQKANAQQQASTEVAAKPKAIENLAAAETTATVTEVRPIAEKPAAPVVAAIAPAPTAAAPLPAPIVVAAAEATLPAAPPIAQAAPSLPVTIQPEPEPVEAADACAITLDLMSEANAMIGVTMLAPCHAGERVVLKHGGLAVTGQTTANGALFTGIPALQSPAMVEVLFSDGETYEASIDMPDLADLRRFAVQWQADDAFQLHAFENGAGYGDAGHISGADPHRPAAGAPAKGGFLTLLGDSTTANPLLAEVYTFPTGAAAKSEVVIEAAVTEATCGRELLGETLTSAAGAVEVMDLTVAMPECDAVGDYLVLKNLAPDLNIASAN